MDPRRFDSLARSLAAPKTRRGLIGGIAALGAGLLGARAGNAQVSQTSCGNQACASNPGGCNPGCVCCVYTNPVTGRVFNSRCRPPGTCSPGTVACPPGQVVGPSGVCVAATTTTTTTAAPPCSTSDQCPSGRVCVNGGCFQQCVLGDDSCPECPGCRCQSTNQDRSVFYCADGNTFIATCETHSECPSGTYCSSLSAGDTLNLCTQPCCPSA